MGPIRDRVVITGLVNLGGLGGMNTPGEAWYAVMHLAAWRRDGGAMVARALRVESKIEHAQLRREMESTKAYAIVRMEVDGFRDDAKIVRPDWSSVRFGASDAQLEAERERLKRPVVRVIDGVGALTLDRRVNTFDGKVEWCGGQVTLMLGAENDSPHAGAVATVKQMMDDSLAWDERMRTHAAAEMTPTYNESWRDEEAEEIDPETMARAMTLGTLTVDAEGSFSADYNVEDLFGGHGIVVEGSIAKGVGRVDLIG